MPRRPQAKADALIADLGAERHRAARGGAVTTAIGRRWATDEGAFFDAQLAQGGLLLWVHTPDPDSERRAAATARHARHVHFHDLPENATRGS